MGHVFLLSWRISRSQLQVGNGLHHAPSSAVRVFSSASRRRRRPVIATLDPHRIRPGDYLDVSDLAEPYIYVTPRGSRTIRSEETRVRLPTRYPGWVRDQKYKFPEETHGFLYYHVPPGRPPCGGEIRFRLTPDNDITNFLSGKDLLMPKPFLPWHIPLWHIAGAAKYTGFRLSLLQNELVTQATLDLCARLYALTQFRHSTQMLYGLDDGLDELLYVRFNSLHVRFYWWHGSHLYRCRLMHALTDARGREYTLPYSGSAFCRLEQRSDPLPAYYLRIIRIVDPVKPEIAGYDDHISKPAEGQLLKRNDRPLAIHVEPVMVDYNGYPPETQADART